MDSEGARRGGRGGLGGGRRGGAAAASAAGGARRLAAPRRDASSSDEFLYERICVTKSRVVFASVVEANFRHRFGYGVGGVRRVLFAHLCAPRAANRALFLRAIFLARFLMRFR